MKRYVPIVIGVLALCAVLYIGNNQMKNDTDVATEEEATTTMLTTSFSGQVTKMFEGENTLEYGFDLPETATTSVEKDGALVKVTEGDMPLFQMYLSFEGGRGYSPADYVSNVIVPNVQAITDNGVTTIGSHEWTVVESQWSVWHIAKSSNGQWLLVVENKKVDNEKVAAIIDSIATNK